MTQKDRQDQTSWSLAFFLSKGKFETNFQAVSTLLGTGVPRFKKTPAPRTLSRPVPGCLWWYYGGGAFSDEALHGYLTHNKMYPPGTLPQAYA